MYSFPNFEPVCCFMSGSNCCFLTCMWVYQETSKVVWYSHLFKNFPHFVVIHTVKGFSVVHEAEVDGFLEFPCFLYDPVILAIWFLVLLFFLSPDCTSGSSRFTYCWGLTFEHNLTSMRKECNCRVVWTFFGIPFFWNQNENWPFPVLWLLLGFPNLLTYWMQHFNSLIF